MCTGFYPALARGLAFGFDVPAFGPVTVFALHVLEIGGEAVVDEAAGLVAYRMALMQAGSKALFTLSRAS